MANITGIVCSKVRGGSTLVNGEYSSTTQALNNSLPKDRIYNIGIDQSTSCTGIYLEDNIDDINILLEFPSSGLYRDEYLKYLFYLITFLLEGVKVNYFIMEDIPNGRYVRASSVLKELKGMISGWTMSIDSLKTATVDCILPQSWKSKVVDKSKSKHRHKDKYLIACDICEKKPMLMRYLATCGNKDYDGFDACGILLGYISKNFTNDGRRLVNSARESRHCPIAFIRYIDRSAMGNASAVLGSLLGYSKLCGIEVLEYNKEASFFENIRMCSSRKVLSGRTEKQHPLSLVALEDESIQSMLHWETDEPYDDNKVFIMVVGRKSELDSFSPGLAKTHYIMIAE